MASRGLLQSTMMTPRLVARSSLQHVNHPAVVMRSTLGRKLASTTSTASGGRTRSGPFKSYPRMTMAAAALLGGAAYIAATRDAEPLQASTAATLDLDPNDPLSALYPHILHASTSHLDDLPLGTLIKTYIVYLGSSQSALVEAGPWMLQKLEWARDNVPIVGNALWSAFAVTMKSTFYSVFVGGPTVPDCAPLVESLSAHGVGCLLNYSAEASNDRTSNSHGINDANVREAVNAVQAAARFDQPGATEAAEKQLYIIKPTLLAIKLTGMIAEPALFARATNALLSSSEYQRGTLSNARLFPDSPELSDEDKQDLNKLYEGLREVAHEAREGGVRLLIDAEQSWYQPAIDRYVDLLAEEFNKATPTNSATGPAIPIVHNTYQAYLRSAPERMQAAMAHAQANNYSFGAKLVRGAYVESERKRWAASGSQGDCVVWSNKAETDACYDECALMLEKQIAQEVMEGQKGQAGTGAVYASHNGTSIRLVLEGLREAGLAKVTDEGLHIDDRVRGRISFAQLLGMSDNLTNSLVKVIAPTKADAEAAAHARVPLIVKYVPYATVDQALPYLIRRAYENQSILQSDPTSGRGGAKEERRAIGREIRRRFGIPF